MERQFIIPIKPFLEIVVPLKIESGVVCQMPECEGNCSIKWVGINSTFQYGDADVNIWTNMYQCNKCGHEFLPHNKSNEFFSKVKAICNAEIPAIKLALN